MSIIAEFSTQSKDFALGGALAAHPEVRVELEKVVPTRRDVFPFFWAWGEELEAFAETLREQPSVSTLDVVDSVDDGVLYRVEWANVMTDLGWVIQQAEATVLDASGQADIWEFELRFPTHDGVQSFQEDCGDRDISLELKRLHSLNEVSVDGQYDLTTEQRDTLLAALEHGYFNEPRDVTLEQLADILDLSPTAVSGRMRRAEATLISRTLLTDS
ncbi:bacterio-opsin activator domain-containing protein [Halorussus halophilus]|uniref:bacterio-opsin activator domain-containing protein n=1 Tax=Halorussus halophilus TaxID=2650975 RepID=UPI0013011CED|nr:helix-turn-helix domain-containing protein [Halorussus halophilus]